MGYGHFDHDSYRAAGRYRRARGLDDFGYSAQQHRRPRDTWAADASLDPFRVDARESRDSAEHPNSTPIAVLFDVTGSMGRVPRILQANLGKLHGMLVERGWATDPQVLFGGIGDADCDRVPLQVGQFESDNKMDEQLRTLFLEGGGGGQQSESYQLAAYFMARHIVTDSWEKRHRKGYLFIIGDELNKDFVDRRQVRSVIGDRLDASISTEAMYAELQDRWHVFAILPGGSSYYNDPRIISHWRQLLGDRFLRLPDPAAVCELIGVLVGMTERGFTVDETVADLDDLGATGAGSVVREALDGTRRELVAAPPRFR